MAISISVNELCVCGRDCLNDLAELKAAESAMGVEFVCNSCASAITGANYSPHAPDAFCRDCRPGR